MSGWTDITSIRDKLRDDRSTPFVWVESKAVIADYKVGGDGPVHVVSIYILVVENCPTSGGMNRWSKLLSLLYIVPPVGKGQKFTEVTLKPPHNLNEVMPCLKVRCQTV